MTYEFTPEMGEISGFGGSYEEACRSMLRAGMEWLDEHSEADPKFHGFKGVYGVIEEDNDDAKALSAAVTSSVPNCTGAMHQAVVSACLFIRVRGWDEYVRQMSKREK